MRVSQCVTAFEGYALPSVPTGNIYSRLGAWADYRHAHTSTRLQTASHDSILDMVNPTTMPGL